MPMIEWPRGRCNHSVTWVSMVCSSLICHNISNEQLETMGTPRSRFGEIKWWNKIKKQSRVEICSPDVGFHQISDQIRSIFERGPTASLIRQIGRILRIRGRTECILSLEDSLRRGIPAPCGDIRRLGKSRRVQNFWVERRWRVRRQVTHNGPDHTHTSA